ncbi:asparaginase [Paenarthrobacter nitroguajacolicus]|uniref:asparaginase n=1 Tax=Paenarthrobacter nitroguajacolicus TaxID=211146 RepID=UPI00405424DB
MRKVVVITTGGTIASTTDGRGVKSAAIPGSALVADIALPVGVGVSVVQVLSTNSYSMTLADLDAVHDAVREALVDQDTCGVVVTHGTDTLEETAMLVDIFHDDPRPVVFTGAQRSADDPNTDGPDNLADAIAVAASSNARGCGVLICFGGVLHAARGTRKIHNSALSAFFDVDNGPFGIVIDRCVRVHSKVSPPSDGPRHPVSIGGTRIDTIAIYPGVDRVALDANVQAGARGIVLQATGYGNANPDIVGAVAEHVRNGIPVVVSSRVAGGPIRGVYGGGGGGADLMSAGAIPAGNLRPSQARILLAALVASGAGVEEIRNAMSAEPTRYVDTPDEVRKSFTNSTAAYSHPK